MKKIICILLISIMLLSSLAALSGCGELGGSDKLSVVTTIFPVYDWVREIMGERADSADLTLLLDNGVDLHNYQPTAADIIKITQCDVFIYVGGESDGWVEDVIGNVDQKKTAVINLLDLLGDAVKENEAIEGMDPDHDHDHDHDDGEEHEKDEHVWLSLKNAKLICSHIEDTLASADPDGKVVYAENAEAYLSNLEALDKKYAETVAAGSKNTLLFGDRFPFRYLADDYGLDYYAAFSGCSSESEASFETIAFLAARVDELGLSVVLTIDGANHKIAETVISNTAAKNAKILSLNSMQSVTAADVESGVTYLSLMEENLSVIGEALK